MSRKFDARANVDGLANRLDATQDADVASVAGGDTNADTYNPTRSVDKKLVGYIVRAYAHADNTGKIHIQDCVAEQLTVAEVIAQATTVLSAGERAEFFFAAGGSVTDPFLQLAADGQNQAVKLETVEVRNRR